MKLFAFGLILLFLEFSLCAAEGQRIKSKLCLHGCPAGGPAANVLIVRDIYILSNNGETKFADWAVYRLVRGTGEADTREATREWRADPWLKPEETLEPADYDGAARKIKVDRGHQVPFAPFKGTPFWPETNYLSNITPQKSTLNQLCPFGKRA